jgi:putative methionine-R-sulfoxide reductase with GAF domain
VKYSGGAMGRFPLVEKEIVSEEKDKPVLDERTLAKLLEAAYVLQEHNRELQEMELGLDLKREQLEAEEEARSAAPGSRAAASKTQATETPASGDYTSTLAEIVATQHQIQVRHLGLAQAIALVADRLVQIARPSGAAIGILDDKKAPKKLRYRATAGLLTLPAGTEVPIEKALCLACLRTGQVLRCTDVNPEFLLDTEECRRRGIQSLIAVPIFHDAEVAGGLELYYSSTQAFTEQDVHTCQLMAGLITEALGRDEEVSLKKSVATERAVMLEALEKLKPNLAALVDKPSAIDPAGGSETPTTEASATVLICRKCGHRIVGEEQFCGNCGTPRIVAYEAPSMQSREASLRSLQEAMKQEAMKKTAPGERAQPEPSGQQSRANPDRAQPEKSLADALEEEMPELFAAAQPLPDNPTASTQFNGPVSAEFEDSILADLEVPLEAGRPHEVAAEVAGEFAEEVVAEEAKEPESKALAKPEHAGAWSSAANARDFLEQLASGKRPGALSRFWNTRRGDIYLAIALILVAVVIRWGIWSSHSVSATGNTAAAATHRKPAPDADLSLFDRMLISLGLAEPPQAPEYKGNPETQVWVDLHTALYYCPGADLYGKTPKGKFASQRDAQLDQFEPASRKACD